MNRKIWKALGIAVCMLALAAPRAMAARYEVGMDDQFIKFGDAVEAINQSGDTENEIVLMQDITLESNYILTNSKTTTIKTTTIKGEDRKIFINGSNDPNAGITVIGEGTVLNLGVNGYDKKLTIDRDPRDVSVPENPRVAFVAVLKGATANMYEHVTLQNGKFAGNACVVIMGSDSAFNMYGGVIENCSRAVTAGSKATFNMSMPGGKILNCGSENDDGGVLVSNATFVMSGGTISGCTADNGGGLYAYDSTINISGGTISECTAKNNGGGLYADNSTVTISGGTISRCKAQAYNGGGLYANNSAINISDGTISRCDGLLGGGLYAEDSSTHSSTVTISDVTISGCTAGAGGGLYVVGLTLNIEDGTISGCTAGVGGGLYADNSTINITDGTISGCTATMKNGGGLYATNSSKITIKGGTISKCTAPADNGGGLYANNSAINISDGTISGCEGRWGGGLYAENSSTITITDSTISGCKAGAGGGLFVVGSTIRISGGIISECTTSDTGNGGGLYAKDSTIKITGGRIENNKAALGGGVALIGKTTFEDSITNWTVIGNEAYATGGVGGGIKLENGSMDVSAGSNRIYNNMADGHGADICLTDDTSSIKLPNAANMNVPYHNSGMKIDGWYEDDNPRYTPSESGEVVKANKWLNGGLSLVASYKADPVRIEIDANGGVGGSSSQTVHEGTTVILEAPTKEGHLFTGWEDKEKGKSYPAGEDGKVNITVNENMTLTAVWKARSFTVTYVLLDGKTRTETAAYGKNVTLVEEPRIGYTFVGWKDGENVYRAGETITVTEDKTLTAVWEARTFTVTYVLLNGETRAETVNYGQTVTLGEEPRTGYTFVGWKDGEKMYHAGETITVTGDMTLTAEWKKLPSAENLPKTGDESPVLLWGAALAVSAAACFVLRRKK